MWLVTLYSLCFALQSRAQAYITLHHNFVTTTAVGVTPTPGTVIPTCRESHAVMPSDSAMHDWLGGRSDRGFGGLLVLYQQL